MPTINWPTTTPVTPLEQSVGSTIYTRLDPDTTLLVQRVTADLTAVQVKLAGHNLLVDSLSWADWQRRWGIIALDLGAPLAWWRLSPPEKENH